MPDFRLIAMNQGFYLAGGKVFTRFVGKATNVVIIKIGWKNVSELT